MKHGFIRAAAATPEIKVGDCKFNSEQIVTIIKDAAANGVSVIVFPELCVTGYTCADLFLHRLLLDSAEKALAFIADETKELDILSIIGLPVQFDGKLYNCAAVVKNGAVLGIVPKENIPNYNEFYEARHFTSGKGMLYYTERFGRTLFGRQLFECGNVPNLVIGVEICEDLWVSNAPSITLAESGATLICNLSASDETVGKAEYRRQLVSSQSARLICGYIYADAGLGESTQDMVFSGHNLIAENGVILKESKRFSCGYVFTEIDFDRINSERRRTSTCTISDTGIDRTGFELALRVTEISREYRAYPFVPSEKFDVTSRCEEILTMQAVGLMTRLKAIGCTTIVMGLSGGLDSTLALIAAVRAFDMMSLDRKGIHAITMPCFGTTARTKSNAYMVAEAYDVTIKEIEITAAVRQHFADIGHDELNTDITYENAQARERTQVLMDIANTLGGIVIGTCDLSEIALGWGTYNGDLISMYGMNCSIPKTLIRHLVAYESEITDNKKLSDVLNDILDTPVSPELLPPENGEISQKTEDKIGPYELHDFFIYYFVRCLFSPAKILRIGLKAFDGKYDEETIKYWLKSFLRRFINQQFKRSCMPDGPKIGSVALSPRGDLRMPSDAVCKLWLEDLE